MKYAPRFLIAKYVPDLRRMEPRNVGVIVWSNGDIRARFSGEKSNGRTEVAPPTRLQIQSRNAYRQWIDYWRALIAKPALNDSRGRAVERDDSEFVSLLASKSKQQFYLAEGGEFLESIKPTELDAVADELFSELVEVESDQPVNQDRSMASRALIKSCKTALDESGLKDRPGFWGGESGFDWFCPVGHTTQPFHFDFAIHFTNPVAILDRVYLWKPEDVFATAFEFGKMRDAYGISRENCAALIYPTEADLADKNVVQMWKMMDEIGMVIDMRDIRTASSRLRSFALVT